MIKLYRKRYSKSYGHPKTVAEEVADWVSEAKLDFQFEFYRLDKLKELRFRARIDLFVIDQTQERVILILNFDFHLKTVAEEVADWVSEVAIGRG